MSDRRNSTRCLVIKLRVIVSLLVLAGFGPAAFAQTPVSCSAATVGNLGALNGWVPSPNDAWHQAVTGASVDPGSANILSSTQDLGGSHLHPDFSTPSDGYYGIPYTVVDSSATPLAPVGTGAYPSESDITLEPIPSTTPIEGNPAQCVGGPNNYVADQHAIVVDRAKCVVYETFNTTQCNGAWSADQQTVWDMSTTEARPYGYTSADAAGLSVFEGLIRYDEIVAGAINHAIRFTANNTKKDSNGGYFTAPATHAAGTQTNTDNIIGMRLRLKATFDISGFSATNQIILRAMQQYGMILADNGSNMFFQGTPDPRWDDNDLNALKAVPASAFDVVQMAPVYDSSTAPTGAAPQIVSFTASADNVSPATSVVLTPTVTGGSYMYIDVAGFTRGPITVAPQSTTTYTLTSRNAYGTASQSVTVHVIGGTPSLAFNTIPNQTYGAAPFAVTATSNSNGQITYSISSGPATISGNTVTLTGAGTVTVQASQAGSGNYGSTTATATFTVNAITPSLAFVPIPTQVYGVAPFAVLANSNSTGAITYSVVSGPATIVAGMH
jgi:hypothetical protein